MSTAPSVRHPRVITRVADRESQRRVFFEQTRDEVAHLRVESLREAQARRLHQFGERVHILRLERQPPDHHQEQQNPAAPRVHLVSGVARSRLRQNLRRTIVQRAARRVQQMVRVSGFIHKAGHGRHAEIGDLDVVGGVEQDIFGFEVAVEDSLLVAVRHALHKLPENAPRVSLRQTTLLPEHLIQLVALDKIHHDEQRRL
mmetsp:Transcript_7025/g.14966  ORF Transcript_7025/g.14966 Transcript_7025/m.14966 type:complete len:201 (-) Transcript_7025:415-1017(-)